MALDAMVSAAANKDTDTSMAERLALTEISRFERKN